MNLDQLRKNIGSLVQLFPPACRLDQNGFELPQISDDWLVDDVAADGVRVRNTRTDHAMTLALDQIHHYTSNPQRGPRHGFFTLMIQTFLQGAEL